MTADMTNLRDLVEKAPDVDLLHELIGAAAARLMRPDTASAAATSGAVWPAARWAPIRSRPRSVGWTPWCGVTVQQEPGMAFGGCSPTPFRVTNLPRFHGQMSFAKGHLARLPSTIPIARRAAVVGVRALLRTDGSHARTPER